MTAGRRIRTPGVKGDARLTVVLRGVARILAQDTVGLAWPDAGATRWERELIARLQAANGFLAAGLGANRALVDRSAATIGSLTAVSVKDNQGRFLAALYAVDAVARRTTSRKARTILTEVAATLGVLLTLRSAETRLDVAEAQLTGAERLLGIGHWSYDLETGSWQGSPTVHSLHGSDPDSPADDLSSLYAQIHGEDVSAIEAAINALTLEPDKIISCNYRVKRPDGGFRYLTSTLGAQVSAAGVLTRISGVAQDNTDSLNLRNQLAQSEAHYRRLAENSNDMIVVCGFDGVISYVSPACEPLLGFSAEDIRGRNLLHLVHPDDQAKTIRDFGPLLSGQIEGDGLVAEYRMVCRDGRAIWIETCPKVVRDPDSNRIVELIHAIRDITQRKRAELALAERDEQFRMLINGSRDLIIRYTPSGEVASVSPAVREIIGYQPEDLVGRYSSEFVHPEDLARVEQHFRRLVKEPGVRLPPMEVRVRGISGDYHVMESMPFAIRDPQTGQVREFIDVSRDITQRKATEAALERAHAQALEAQRVIEASERRYRILADSARDLTLQFGSDGVIHYASPSAIQMGYQPEDLVGRRIVEFLHPDDVAASLSLVADHFRNPDAKPVGRGESRVLTKSGDYVWLEGSPSLLKDDSGQTLMVNSTFRDVTERRTLEESLVKARHQAEAAAAAKADFLANMSHELRTPLTSVIGYSQQIQGEANLSDRVRRAADRIVAGGRSLLSTINDILDFSKIEAGDIQISAAPAGIASLIDETLDLLHIQAAQKGLDLRAEGLDGLPPFLLVDANRVGQVLVNLIGNAIKFTPAGQVTVAASFDEATSLLRLSVTDSGIGIAPEHLPRLFARFSQVDESISRRFGGTGLGLAICRGLVEAMGGAITVDSVEGQGSTFRIELPTPACDTDREIEGAETLILPPGLKVLVADDHPDVREVISVMLQSLGLGVDAVSSAAEAISAAEAQPYDLVLLDWHMPGMTGIEAAQAIRSGVGPNRFSPMLLCSADSDAMTDSRADLFDGRILKPISTNNLLGAVVGALDPDPFALVQQTA